MELINLINTLDNHLTRNTRNNQILTYNNPTGNFTITYTTNTEPDPITRNNITQICLRKNNKNNINIYINNLTRRNYTKTPLTELNSITITC